MRGGGREGGRYVGREGWIGGHFVWCFYFFSDRGEGSGQSGAAPGSKDFCRSLNDCFDKCLTC